MDLALWIAAAVLAVVALLGGISKTFIPKARLDAMDGTWTTATGAGPVKALGVLELIAAVGLIVPPLVGIAPVLVPVTATCWVVLMIGAMVTHARLGQPKLVALTGFYLAVALFIAWGRFVLEPFGA
ncbi:DoxX family protein [Myceligenerans pegani]|uniref:DoxX family protein n=1 Tax=Myceligenerans pegani TaxID=2776917 RepID=A0ABR9N0N3_9MICO|nr:DoxX family protein [Myceligenerans sp. TRM 65318]MBE1877216.1 DoxX family protein [Myceligenerans sp. TRM 65318]MBE3019487.1 DoxX family protein [Myceligenerans sp. TRM 65318]